MNERENLHAAAPRVYVRPTFKYIHDFEKQRNFKIHSLVPPIHQLDCSIVKGKRCFKFQTDDMIRNISLVPYQSRQYGLMETFELRTANEVIIVPDGAGKVTTSLGQGFKSSGELQHLERNFDDVRKCYYRALLPLADFTHLLMDYVASSSFHMESGFRAAGYIQLNVDDIAIGIFDGDAKPGKYMIIDSYSQISYPDFEQLLGAVCYVSGLISGSLVRNEVYILQSDDPELQSFIGLKYRKVEDSLNSVAPIAPRIAREYYKVAETTYMDKQIFAKLVSGCLKDNRLLRAIKLMTESANAPLQIRAASFSVALETMKNIIIEENEEKINPMKRSFGRKVVKRLKEVLDEFDVDGFNNKQIVINKLEQLNQVSNTDSFQLSFDLIGIKLEQAEIDSLSLRNEFLHGRIPFEDEPNSDPLLLQRITLKLHFLVCALILKYKGYEGDIINNMSFIEIQNRWPVSSPLFRKI